MSPSYSLNIYHLRLAICYVLVKLIWFIFFVFVKLILDCFYFNTIGPHFLGIDFNIWFGLLYG